MLIKALTFDVFGTLVDWRGGVARDAEALLAPKGFAKDWGAFADAWRSRYQPAMRKVRRGARPFTTLDVLHRENLVELLAEEGIEGLTDAEVDHLNRAWHRLDPWPDVVPGLHRLKARYIVASLSNGNVALAVNLAKRAGLPWDVILGGDVAGAYKPSGEAYLGAARRLALAPEECMMVAAHPTDLEAAASRGFRTAYVHRPLEDGPGRESVRPQPGTFDFSADDLLSLAALLGC
jgi:2-haloacid dehalogenase